jgi:hypothetical protein
MWCQRSTGAAFPERETLTAEHRPDLSARFGGLGPAIHRHVLQRDIC